MKEQHHRYLRLVIVAAVAFTVATAVSIDNFFLAFGAVMIGMLSMALLRRNAKTVLVDERIENISGRAARVAYSVVTMTLVALSLFFIMASGHSNDLYAESLGVALSFVALFNVALYSISYYYFNHRYGGNQK